MCKKPSANYEGVPPWENKDYIKINLKYSLNHLKIPIIRDNFYAVATPTSQKSPNRSVRAFCAFDVSHGFFFTNSINLIRTNVLFSMCLLRWMDAIQIQYPITMPILCSRSCNGTEPYSICWELNVQQLYEWNWNQI